MLFSQVWMARRTIRSNLTKPHNFPLEKPRRRAKVASAAVPELPVPQSARATEPVLEPVPPDILIGDPVDPPSM